MTILWKTSAAIFKLIAAKQFPLLAAGCCAVAGLLVIAASQTRVSDESINLSPIAVFPDFASFARVSLKKQMFFDYIELYVDENNRLLEQSRQRLLDFAAVSAQGKTLSNSQRAELDRLAERYLSDADQLGVTELLAELLKRVDKIPAPLALAQAATESAWGTSRFAVEGNNIFGQWCYDDGCGIVPARRSSEADHEVRAFASVDAAVRAYFLNLNTHFQYENFRDLRLQMREEQDQLDALSLAGSLDGYSERGEQYVDEIQTLIRQNDLVSKYSG